MDNLSNGGEGRPGKSGGRAMFFCGTLFGVVLIMVINTALNNFSALSFGEVEKELGIEEKLGEMYRVLDDHFVDAYDKEELEEYMYAGLISGIGDPYTSYMDKKTLDRFMQQTEGTYAGIGVVVTADVDDNTITVVTPYENAPGAKAGVLPGDKFIKVNGFEVTGSELDVAVEMMKGQPGTTVNVTVFRESENRIFDMEIVREQINIPTVSHKMVDDGIGYIRITNFERVTYNQFVTAYNDLNSQNMRGLVIDVRNNPGGLLDVVARVANLLVPEGDGFIVYTEDKNGKKEYIPSDASRIHIPLAVLVNGNSASASEILSGAVKDMGVGVLVGTTTYGKGLVQNLYPISDGSALKVTIAKYYTPSGVCINGEGIEPDYVVDMSDELSVQISTLTLDEDVQLSKALEIIKEKAQ